MDDIKKINDIKTDANSAYLFRKKEDDIVEIINGLPHASFINMFGEKVTIRRMDAPETPQRAKAAKNYILDEIKKTEHYNMYYRNLVNFNHYEDRAAKDDFTWEIKLDGYTYVSRFERYIRSEQQYMDCRDPKSTGDKFNEAWKNMTQNKWSKNMLGTFSDEAEHAMASYTDLQMIRHLMQTFFSCPDERYMPFNLKNKLYGNEEFYELLTQFNPFPYKYATSFEHLCDYVSDRGINGLHYYEERENCPKAFRFIYFIDACKLLTHTSVWPNNIKNVSTQEAIQIFAENFLVLNIKNKETYTIIENFVSEITEVYNKLILSVLKIMNDMPDSYFDTIRNDYFYDYSKLNVIESEDGGGESDIYIHIYPILSEIDSFINKYFLNFKDAQFDAVESIFYILEKYMKITNNLNNTVAGFGNFLFKISDFYNNKKILTPERYICATVIATNADILNNWRIKDSDLQYTPLSELPDSVEYTGNHYYMNVIREGAESTFNQPKQKGVKNKLSFLKGLFVKNKK